MRRHDDQKNIKKMIFSIRRRYEDEELKILFSSKRENIRTTIHTLRKKVQLQEKKN